MDQSFISQTMIRHANENDHNFILNSWLTSCRQSPMFSECPDRILYDKLSGIVESIVLTKKVAILAASDYADQILAWLCYERLDEPGINTVYFCYTKKPYRELGAQRYMFAQLLGDDPIQYAMPTRVGHKVAKSLAAIYNPFVILR